MIGGSSVGDAVLGLIVLLISVILHENAHGVVALWLGDDTAKKAGRLTLNPVKHLDPVGSVIMPVFMFFSIGRMFGYAKPVPVNPRNLKGTDKTGFAIVAAAGPLSNFIIAFIATILFKHTSGVPDQLFVKVLVYFIEWNLLLAAFNLLPIPPLDGSRFLRLFLTPSGRQTLDRIEPFGFLILFGLLFFLQEPLFRIVSLIRGGLVRLLPI